MAWVGRVYPSRRLTASENAASVLVSAKLAKTKRFVLLKSSSPLCVWINPTTQVAPHKLKVLSWKMSSYDDFDNHAQEIEPLLFLGDSDASAADLNELNKRNIKNILIAGMGLLRYHSENAVR